MNFDQQIRTALRKEAAGIKSNLEMKAQILDRIEVQKKQAKPLRKRLVLTIISACIFVPSVVFAGYSYLADQIWGSSENIKMIGGTQKDYDHFETKLLQAQKTLNIKEFAEFMVLLKDITYYHLKMADLNGKLHLERLDQADREKYEKVVSEIEPYFEKLNKASGIQ